MYSIIIMIITRFVVKLVDIFKLICCLLNNTYFLEITRKMNWFENIIHCVEWEKHSIVVKVQSEQKHLC